MMEANDRFMRLAEVRQAVALSRSTIYRMVERGEFPRPVKLGERSSAWVESGVHAWMQRRRGAADLDAWVPSQVFEAPIAPRDPIPAEQKAAARTGPAEPEDLEDPGVPANHGVRAPDWPHLMRRRTAAAFLDLSEIALEREIAAGRLPPPIRLGGRNSWSRHRLEEAVAALYTRADRERRTR